MGCYDFTCAVSNLPISAGGDVVALMIQSARFMGAESSQGDWFLRSLPVYGKYNDYGSIEDYEDNILTKTWVQGLQHDLIEKGVGNNQFHDIGCRKDMTFDSLLQALVYRDQVQVRYYHKADEDADTADRRERYSRPSADVPSLGAIEAHLGDLAGYVNVDEPRFNEFRVRHAPYSENVWPHEDAHNLLEKCLERLLPHYAAMHTAGSGSYANDSELVVRPRPGAKDGEHRAQVSDKDFARGRDRGDVTLIMVRRDVWEYLLAKKMDKYEVEQHEELLNRMLEYIFWQPDTSLHEGLASRVRAFTIATMSMWTDTFPVARALHEAVAAYPPSAEDEAVIRQEFTKLAKIRSVVSTNRRVTWAPRTLVGEQHGDFREFARYHKAMAEIARKAARASES